MSDEAKRAAAAAAVAMVEPGMALGLGTGSTAAHFVRLLGERIARGLEGVRGTPTSEATASLARACGVPLFAIDDDVAIDLAVDGADEIDPNLGLIKGGGAALLREKIVAAAARRFVVIADASKRVDRLGAFPLPVEIEPFGAQRTVNHLRQACGGRSVAIRRDRDGSPILTDGRHWIADCALGAILDPEGLAARLQAIPGIIDHGLFLGMAHEALIAHPDGTIERLRP